MSESSKNVMTSYNDTMYGKLGLVYYDKLERSIPLGYKGKKAITKNKV